MGNDFPEGKFIYKYRSHFGLGEKKAFGRMQFLLQLSDQLSNLPAMRFPKYSTSPANGLMSVLQTRRPGVFWQAIVRLFLKS